MQKNIATSYGGVNASVGDLLVNRLIPNRYIQAVGPIIFLDHLYPVMQKAGVVKPSSGEFAHPHRGMTTLSYLFSGALEHFDSRGNHGVVSAGGLQWMNAGNGIVHDEQVSPELREQGGLLHGVQFWINLPAREKAGDPAYRALPSADVPELGLPGNAGVLRVLLGRLGEISSPLPVYSRQFIYHIRLNAKSSFTLEAEEGLEYAAFVPAARVNINGMDYTNSELVVFDGQGRDIVMSNTCIDVTDLLIFGGEPYLEPIVAQGPFVMNAHSKISAAYKDFFNGKYGEIDYAVPVSS